MINPTLIQLLASFKHIKTIRELNFFLEAVFSPQEMAQIPKRLECLKRIGRRESYKKISSELKVSICTIARASNLFKALQKENFLWWVNFKKLHGIPTEEYKDVFAELGIFANWKEKQKWLKRRREVDGE